MPRKPRLFSPEIAYHVIARGNNRTTLFRCRDDFETFLGYLAFFKTQYSFELFHYCLMTNHVHLLMRFPDRETFQKVPQRLCLNYAKHVARTQAHVGHVFQDRFRSFAVKDDRYLLECGRYIERNPVNAHMVADAGDYPWSSFRFYAFGNDMPIITPNPMYLDLSPREHDRRLNYQALIRTERPYEKAVEFELFGKAVSGSHEGKVST